MLDLKDRNGVKGCLENKKTIDNYPKFLKFRDLTQTAMDIRAEAPTQTAMTDPGVTIGDLAHPATPDQTHENWDRINTMEDSNH